MNKSPITALMDAIIFTGTSFVESNALLIQDGKVIDITANNKIPPGTKHIHHPNQMIVPGFIDCQVNGGGNVALNETPTPETVLTMAKAHRQYGTTMILPTCITDKIEIMQASLQAVRAAREQDPSILGIHFEGPHINPKKRGCHAPQHIRPLSDQEKGLYRPYKGEIMMVTLAPESVSPQDIQYLCDQGVIVSLGHTEAEPEETMGALAAGARGFTHLYNGMSGMTAREPGVAGCALDNQESWCGLIGDGYHVSSPMIRLALRAKPKKIFLVSDAMPPSATKTPAPFSLQGEQIENRGGRCVTKDGHLAGSSCTLSDAVCHCIRHVGIDPAEALRMASTHPAAFLGLGEDYGQLLPGYTANYTILGYDFMPVPL